MWFSPLIPIYHAVRNPTSNREVHKEMSQSARPLLSLKPTTSINLPVILVSHLESIFFRSQVKLPHLTLCGDFSSEPCPNSRFIKKNHDYFLKPLTFWDGFVIHLSVFVLSLLSPYLLIPLSLSSLICLDWLIFFSHCGSQFSDSL